MKIAQSFSLSDTPLLNYSLSVLFLRGAARKFWSYYSILQNNLYMPQTLPISLRIQVFENQVRKRQPLNPSIYC